MIILCGKSGAGKTTIAKLLEEKHGMHRAVTCTTRPRREGEVNGKDYHFLSEEKFSEMEKEGKFAETAHTGVYSYGSLKESYHDPDAVIILDPDGVRHISHDMARARKGYQIMTAYLYGSDRLLKSRLTARGDDPAEVKKRLAEDNMRFDGLENLCDFQFLQTKETDPEAIALFLAEMAKAKE